MEEANMEKDSTIKAGIAKAAVIALAAVAAILILSNAYLRRNADAERISVTGLGEKDFESDLVVWSGSFGRVDMDLKSAYARLDSDQTAIRSFLSAEGIPEKEYTFSAVSIEKMYDTVVDRNESRRSVFTGYRLEQRLRVESGDVDRVEGLSRKITELINKGVEFYSQEPQYYCTKLSELKMELVEEATKNARERAEKIAANSGTRLGGLKRADMGVFQILARNSNDEYSWGGTLDTASKLKTATITMRLQFGIRN
jgi:hypothetical protein